MKRSTWLMVLLAIAILGIASSGPHLLHAVAATRLSLPAWPLPPLQQQDLTLLIAALLAMLLLAGRQRRRRIPTVRPRVARLAALDSAGEARRLRVSRDGLRLLEASAGRDRKLLPLRQESPAFRPAPRFAGLRATSAGAAS